MSQQTRSARRAACAAFVGTVIDWYDFFLYGTAAALVFPKLFFPTLDVTTGTIASFATFATGFVARPLGGIIFGHLGDKVGRRWTLICTLVVMGLSTAAVGCLPGYDTIGLAAPILLAVTRFLQGLAVGGEWGGAALLAVEHSTDGRRGWYGSWTQAGLPVGLLLSTAVFDGALRLSSGGFNSWGWRIPFLLGLVLTLVGYLIRQHVSETPVFDAAKGASALRRMPLIDAVRFQWRRILIVAGARLAENAAFYLFTVFVLSYGTVQLHVSKKTLLNSIMAGAVLELVVILGLGHLSDRVGRKLVLIAGTAVFCAFIFPYFWLLELRQTWAVACAIIVSVGVAHGAMYAAQASFFSELFGSEVRYSGASLGYQLAAPIAGGLSPILAVKLLDAGSGEPWLIAAYMLGMGVVSILSAAAAPETLHKSISNLATTMTTSTDPAASPVR